jgi:hypothetical protein
MHNVANFIVQRWSPPAEALTSLEGQTKAAREGAKSAPSERTLLLAEVVRENLFAFVVREGMKAAALACGASSSRSNQYRSRVSE